MTRLYEKKDNLIRKNPNLTEEQKQEIIEVLNKYPNLENNVDWNKNKYLTYEDFKELILDKAGKSRSQAKKKGISGLTEGTDYDILYNKDGETLYAVYTHLASKVLASNRVEPQIWTESKVMDWSEEDDYSGRKTYRNEEDELIELRPGAKWCISMNDSYHWDDYTANGLYFLFLFRNNSNLSDEEKKLAISVDEGGEIIDITDASDISDLDYYYVRLSSKVLEVIEKYIDRKAIEHKIKKYGLKLNTETNRYDYIPNDYTGGFLNAKSFVRKDKKGFVIDFGYIEGNFWCSDTRLISLEGAPQEVSGYFDCSDNRLTSLEGAPTEVGGWFDCSNNRLTSLEGAPQTVGESFDCFENQLSSLEGAPQTVGGYFDCHKNQLTSLKGAPQKVGRSFYCGSNQLTSLEGAPQTVGGRFDCSYTELTSLEGAPRIVGENFDCSSNQLTSLKGAPTKVGGKFNCSWNQLTSLKGAPQEVGGGFNCRENQLTSLEGAPQEVGGWFDCSYTELTSLEGAPIKVGGDFDCSNNQLTSLEEAPQTVEGDFECRYNPNLHSLEGIGEVKGEIIKDF